MNEQDPNFSLALSIRQPWVEMILRGLKQLELRRWNPDYRGLLWLHAARNPASNINFPISEDRGDLFTGGYVGSAVLRASLPLDHRRWEAWRFQQCDTGCYVPGFLGWVFSEVIRFNEPLAAPGKVGLFSPSAEHLTSLLTLKCDATHS